MWGSVTNTVLEMSGEAGSGRSAVLLETNSEVRKVHIAWQCGLPILDQWNTMKKACTKQAIFDPTVTQPSGSAHRNVSERYG